MTTCLQRKFHLPSQSATNFSLWCVSSRLLYDMDSQHSFLSYFTPIKARLLYFEFLYNLGMHNANNSDGNNIFSMPFSTNYQYNNPKFRFIFIAFINTPYNCFISDYQFTITLLDLPDFWIVSEYTLTFHAKHISLLYPHIYHSSKSDIYSLQENSHNCQMRRLSTRSIYRYFISHPSFSPNYQINPFSQSYMHIDYLKIQI